ncbi:MAG: ferredoxin [Clostridiales bacterium]|nr:ferredoxin [Clostridiales bacterium]
MKTKVNEDCIGCGMCVEVCPEVFEINGDGMSHVVGDPDACADQTLQAAEICPVNAIEVQQ